MLFREATTVDIPGMQLVRNSVLENKLPDSVLISYNDYEVYLTQRGRAWVCEMDNSIVGFSVVDMQEHNIWALFVHPDHEKKGIGKKLHDIMLAWYFQQTDVPVWLSTGPHTRAAHFYRQAGWKEVGMHGREIKFEMQSPMVI